MKPPPPFRIGGHLAHVERHNTGSSVYVGDVEHLMKLSPERDQARRALLAATQSAPVRPAYESYDEYAQHFTAYQREVLDPLRERLRAVVLQEETAFIADLEEVYA